MFPLGQNLVLSTDMIIDEANMILARWEWFSTGQMAFKIMIT